MEIDLSLVVNQPECLRRFLNGNHPILQKWWDAVYAPTKDSIDVSQYVQRIDRSSLIMLRLALEIDRVSGLRLAMAYFQNVFEARHFIELKFLDADDPQVGRMDGMFYDTSINMKTFKLEGTKLIVVNEFFHQVSNTDLIGAMSHEMWHAAQHEMIIQWLRESGGILDLEKASPQDDKVRGALYALNTESYISPREDNLKQYTQQLMEAEAEAIRMEVLRFDY